MGATIIIVSIILLVWFALKKAKRTVPSAKNKSHRPLAKHQDDHDIWVHILKDGYPHISSFELFGTKASVLWNEGDPEIEVVCVTAFVNGAPKTKKWDHFAFHVHEGYWIGVKPRGCAAEIRQVIDKLGLKQICGNNKN